MPKVHIINVSPGDCSIIQHRSGRTTVIDICGGNLEVRQQAAALETRVADIREDSAQTRLQGNYGMCKRPSNPINYMLENGIDSVFRFILSHPDMDHMDGLRNLIDKLGIINFWETGARRNKKEFGDNFFRFNEDDWDAYERIINGKEPGIKLLTKIAGDRFSYANQAEKDGKGGQDGLYILAPSKDLLSDPDENDDINESSYIIGYHSSGGRLIFPGDAHDASWEYAMKHHADSLKNCAFLLAPHHGRDSDRSYEFLDFMQPKLTFLGCAPSKYIDYDQWRRRDLPIITSNQSGNMVLDIQEGFYDVYIENVDFAADSGCNLAVQNEQGYIHYKRIQA